MIVSWAAICGRGEDETVMPDDIAGTAVSGVFAIEVRSRVEVGGGDDSAGAFGRIVIGDFTDVVRGSAGVLGGV